MEREQERLLRKPNDGAYVYNVVLARSTLSRYERGALPPLELAQHLDQLYEADGWIDLGLRTLWRPKWHPWLMPEAYPQAQHFIKWAAGYSGPVWVKVVPAAGNDGQDHRVTLRWGPWVQMAEVTLPENGLVLVTGKAADDDGHAVTLNLTCDKVVHVLSGAGQDLDGEIVLGISDGWNQV